MYSFKYANNVKTNNHWSQMLFNLCTSGKPQPHIEYKGAMADGQEVWVAKLPASVHAIMVKVNGNSHTCGYYHSIAQVNLELAQMFEPAPTTRTDRRAARKLANHN